MQMAERSQLQVHPSKLATCSCCLLILLAASPSLSLRIQGEWTNLQLSTILVKFGFQKAESLNWKRTLGYIYGNVTDATPTADGETPHDHKVLLVLLTQNVFDKYRNFDGDCGELLAELSKVSYEAHCFYNGTEDFFRVVPCPAGELCSAEDTPVNVIDGAQFTYRVHEKVLPGFWYLALVSCALDRQCAWQRQPKAVTLNYDIWLVNGDPTAAYANPFEHQFSFDEQDTAEIYFCALVLFGGLSLLQLRAVSLMRAASADGRAPRRFNWLLYMFVLQTLSVSLSLLHVCIFSYDGWGLWPARWLADCLWIACINGLTIFIILLARGWSIITTTIVSDTRMLAAAIGFTLVHLFCFVLNSSLVDPLEEIDIYQTWPGWCIMLLRAVCMCWFIAEVRHTVARCLRRSEEHKAEFVTHFGAGYLVWLVHIPALALVASKISFLWRFKLLLGITYMADFLAGAILLHLMWPSSSNRHFFIDLQPISSVRRQRFSSSGQHDEPEDYEFALINDVDDFGEDEGQQNVVFSADSVESIPVDPIAVHTSPTK